MTAMKDPSRLTEPVRGPHDGGFESTSYNVHRVNPVRAEELIRKTFPDWPDEMNFILFSTSGVHGSYTTLEDAEAALNHFGDKIDEVDWETESEYHRPEVTFVIVQPRRVNMFYGNVRVTLGNLGWLKTLRAKSWEAVEGIG